MFIAVRKYQVRRNSAAEWARRVQAGFVPLMRELEGFREYYLLDGGPGVVITVSMFDSADAALMSNAKAADWVRHNVLEFARGMPEVIVGDVLIAEVKEEPAVELSNMDPTARGVPCVIDYPRPTVRNGSNSGCSRRGDRPRRCACTRSRTGSVMWPSWKSSSPRRASAGCLTRR